MDRIWPGLQGISTVINGKPTTKKIFSNFWGKDINNSSCNSWEVPAQAFMLGLTSGTAEGIFSPDLPLTREMAVVMLTKLRLLLQSDKLIDEQDAGKILQMYAKDSEKISDWAKIHMADAYSRGIITGTDIGILSPKDHVTREQAVILTLNTLAYSGATRIIADGITNSLLPAPSGIYIAPSYQRGDVNLTWGQIPSASAYEVKIYKNNNIVYSARTKNHNLDFRTSSQQNTKTTNLNTIFGHDRETVKLVLEVIPIDKEDNLSLFSLRREFTVIPNNNKRVGSITSRSQTRFNSAAEAFNGPEKFPIKSCYGYSYRGTSQHSSGLAIDINPDENYFIGRDGTIKAGKLWKPGENPYSILPDGDVVRAFKKYGWHWSPEMNWSNGADYMHFSLLGT
jgi:hypothetical protein